MVYDYIRRTYGVNPRVGQRVTADGKPGTIVRPPRNSDPAHLRIRLDGDREAGKWHPTWRIDYAPTA